MADSTRCEFCGGTEDLGLFSSPCQVVCNPCCRHIARWRISGVSHENVLARTDPEISAENCRLICGEGTHHG